MALFGNKGKKIDKKESSETNNIIEKKEKIEKKDIIQVSKEYASILEYGVKIKAELESKGSLFIGGDFEGTAVVKDSVVIENNANFKGKLKAKNVKISGNFEGELTTEILEITKNARFKGLINAKKTFLAGDVKAIIKSIDILEVLPSGKVDTKESKSKNIKILGKIYGRVIASEMLEVVDGGSIEGTIVTKGIKTQQGGTILGNIQTFDESIHGVDIKYTLEDILEDEKIDNNLSIKNIEKIPQDLQKYAKNKNK